MALGASAWGHDGLSLAGKDYRNVAAYAIDRGDSLIGAVFSGFKARQQVSPGNTVIVGPGRLILPATQAGLWGAYGGWNDADMSSPTIAATSTNGRHDRLIFRVVAGQPQLQIIPGTPSGTPSAPAITGDNFLALYRIEIPPSTTNITDAFLKSERVFGGQWARPWGFLNEAVITSPSTPAGGAAFVAGLQITLAPPANRKIKLTIGAYAHFLNGAGDVAVSIWRDSATKLADRLVASQASGVSLVPGSDLSVTFTSDGLSHTYQFGHSTTAAQTNVHCIAGGPAFIRAEDLGAAGSLD